MTSPQNRIVSVLIPAHNEAAYIAECLAALYASSAVPPDHQVEVLVLANGCTDQTAEIARSRVPPRGWSVLVLERAEGGKLAALTEGDAKARGQVRVYLDADVQVETGMLAQIATALASDAPRYASGSPCVKRAKSPITRAYAAVWTQLPFVTTGAPGFGLFAMTSAGRARWESWPDIISDDTFARLNFTPDERIRLPGRYHWPMVEGFRNLVRVRRRQDHGVAEIAQRFPELLPNDDPRPLSKAQLLGVILRHPIGFVVYAAVSLAVRTRLFATKDAWARGR